MILAGYLGGQYALDKPLTLSASLSFEQIYTDVEGDSASSAELYAILSSLSGLPIKQSIAVTGSVNQRGEIQPIGGAQHKIEGFFQGLPSARADRRAGRDDPASKRQEPDAASPRSCRRAPRASSTSGPSSTIDEGIELLTGVPAGQRDESGQFPAGTVHARVEARLKELAEGIERFDPRALAR